MGVRVHAAPRHGRRPTVQARRRALRASLTASGAIPAVRALPTYELTQGNVLERFFLDQALASSYPFFGGDSWPCDATLAHTPEPLMQMGHAAVYQLDEHTLAYVSVSDGWASTRVACTDQGHATAAFSAFRQQYPASYLIVGEDTQVPITFWTLSRYGAVSRLRRIDASAWEPIQRNYSTAVQVELGELMGWHDGPGRDGQLLLWQGPPGTGKTWALRALASEWSSWAEFHYITDPDAFFVEDPSYMVDVLLADSYDVVEPSSGDIYTEADPEGKWRILILEDTGELLSATAKERYGQGLSRLLNVVDGMIGQGLRVLALVTTNDELDDLNPAATRPGRCASQIVFGSLSDDEAAAWTGRADAEAGTIAELYARYGEPLDALTLDEEPDELVASGCQCAACGSGTAHFSDCAVHNEPAFRNGPCDCGALVAAAEEPDVVAEIRRVADEHRGDATGYGETAWDAETATVFYVCGDWTDPDPIEADFLAIDGVDHFECEYEGLPDGWCEAEIVWPENVGENHWTRAACADQAAALAAVVALAAAPIVIEPEPSERSSGNAEHAFVALRAVHAQTVKGITTIVAATQAR